jgi:hypothetical protein
MLDMRVDLFLIVAADDPGKSGAGRSGRQLSDCSSSHESLPSQHYRVPPVRA